jgi:hypothetical protein
VRLNFASKDEAIAYAERNGIAYSVEEPKPARKTRACPIPTISSTNRASASGRIERPSPAAPFPAP